MHHDAASSGREGSPRLRLHRYAQGHRWARHAVQGILRLGNAANIFGHHVGLVLAWIKVLLCLSLGSTVLVHPAFRLAS